MFHVFYNPINEEISDDWSGMANQETPTSWVPGSVMVMLVCDMGYICGNIIHPFFLLRVRRKSKLLFFVGGSQEEESCWGRGWWGWHSKNLLRGSELKALYGQSISGRPAGSSLGTRFPLDGENGLCVYLFTYF